jgi:hypothetical protein
VTGRAPLHSPECHIAHDGLCADAERGGAELANALNDNRRMRALLAKHQYNGNAASDEYDGKCPECEGVDPEKYSSAWCPGHHPRCPLAELLIPR